MTDGGPDAGAAAGMPSAYAYDHPPAREPRPPLVRSRTRGWTPGVCGAVARHLGVSRRSVRITFILLTLAKSPLGATVHVLLTVLGCTLAWLAGDALHRAYRRPAGAG